MSDGNEEANLPDIGPPNLSSKEGVSPADGQLRSKAIRIVTLHRNSLFDKQKELNNELQRANDELKRVNEELQRVHNELIKSHQNSLSVQQLISTNLQKLSDIQKDIQVLNGLLDDLTSLDLLQVKEIAKSIIESYDTTHAIHITNSVTTILNNSNYNKYD